MKYIYLIRHAKAQKDPKTEDLQRDLSSSGKEDLKTMCSRLKTLNFQAECIFSSPAKRCIKTAQKLCKTFDIKEKDIFIEQSFYQHNITEILNFISSLQKSRVVFIMHNPILIQLCEYLALIDIDNFPTSSIMCLKFDVCSFKDIKEQSGELVFFDYPKSKND